MLTNIKKFNNIRFQKSSNLKQIFWCFLLLEIVKTALGQEFGQISGEWKIQYGIEDDLPDLRLTTDGIENVPLVIYDIDRFAEESTELYFEISIANTNIATVEKRINISDISGTSWQGDFQVMGHHFGYTELYITLNDPSTYRMERHSQELDVIVVREKRVNDRIYTYTAAAIMLLMFINLGTVLDLKRLAAIFMKPIGPLLGFASRFIVMPGLALGLGALIFKDNKRLQLAIFFTALSPSGGIANICNVFLRGNINLSLATTTINSVLALGMLPLWIFLLGPVLHKESTLKIPFVDLAVGCIGFLLALFVGIILRLCIPKTTKFIFRFLKPVSIFLSLCLVAVTVGINAFVFKEITFLIFLACLFLPFIGYILSFVLSKLLCRTPTDAMTIAIETGVLNMTLPILLLQYTLEQPMADMVIVVPITAALTSLCLVLIFYIVRRIFGWNNKRDLEAFDEEAFLEK